MWPSADLAPPPDPPPPDNPSLFYSYPSSSSAPVAAPPLAPPNDTSTSYPHPLPRTDTLDIPSPSHTLPPVPNISFTLPSPEPLTAHSTFSPHPPPAPLAPHHALLPPPNIISRTPHTPLPQRTNADFPTLLLPYIYPARLYRPRRPASRTATTTNTSSIATHNAGPRTAQSPSIPLADIVIDGRFRLLSQLGDYPFARSEWLARSPGGIDPRLLTSAAHLTAPATAHATRSTASVSTSDHASSRGTVSVSPTAHFYAPPPVTLPPPVPVPVHADAPPDSTTTHTTDPWPAAARPHSLPSPRPYRAFVPYVHASSSLPQLPHTGYYACNVAGFPAMPYYRPPPNIGWLSTTGVPLPTPASVLLPGHAPAPVPARAPTPTFSYAYVPAPAHAPAPAAPLVRYRTRPRAAGSATAASVRFNAFINAFAPPRPLQPISPTTTTTNSAQPHHRPMSAVPCALPASSPKSHIRPYPAPYPYPVPVPDSSSYSYAPSPPHDWTSHVPAPLVAPAPALALPPASAHAPGPSSAPLVPPDRPMTTVPAIDLAPQWHPLPPPIPQSRWSHAPDPTFNSNFGVLVTRPRSSNASSFQPPSAPAHTSAPPPPLHLPLSCARSDYWETDSDGRSTSSRSSTMPKISTKEASKVKASGSKKAKKDENKPKRALSAYMFFVQDWRERIKAENPDASFGETGKLLGARWKEMSESEKKPYNDQAEKDKQRAAKEKTAYDASNGKVKKAAKKPVSEEDDDEDDE